MRGGGEQGIWGEKSAERNSLCAVLRRGGLGAGGQSPPGSSWGASAGRLLGAAVRAFPVAVRILWVCEGAVAPVPRSVGLWGDAAELGELCEAARLAVLVQGLRLQG